MGPIPFALDEVLRATGAVTIRWPGARHVRPIHDLRYATPGALFFPLYMHVLKEFVVKELVRTQATGLVVYEDHLPPWLERYPQLGVLSVRSPFQSYLRLARLARSRVHGPVAGITGSSGKSSTKGFLAAILQGRYRVHANPGSYNVISDTAAVLMGMTGDPTEAAVLEMGLGRPGDIDRMAALAKPWVSVITKVTNDHLDATKGSWEQLVLEKGAIGRYLPEDGFLLINADDPGCSLLNRSDYRSRVHTFGTGPTAICAACMPRRASSGRRWSCASSDRASAAGSGPLGPSRQRMRPQPRWRPTCWAFRPMRSARGWSRHLPWPGALRCIPCPGV